MVKRLRLQLRHSDMEVKQVRHLRKRRVNSHLLVVLHLEEVDRKFSSQHSEVAALSGHQVRTQSLVAQQHLHPSSEVVANRLQEVQHLLKNRNPYSVKASILGPHLRLNLML